MSAHIYFLYLKNGYWKQVFFPGYAHSLIWRYVQGERNGRNLGC